MLRCTRNDGLLAQEENGKYQGKINHVFSWQASLPSSALSNDKKRDTSDRQNCFFPHVMEATKKMTVLYNQNDTTLKRWYDLANYIYEKHGPYSHKSIGAESVEEHMARMVSNVSQPRMINIPPALGLVGPLPKGQETSWPDDVKKLFDNGRIILADMTPYASGHSYMKVPNQDVMDKGYKGYILNQKWGITKFGNYDGSLFQKK